MVNNYKWQTLEEFSDTLAIGNALPGPIATKMAGYVGWKIAGLPGALLALLGMIRAIRPVVVVLLAQLTIELWPKAVGNWRTALVGVVSFVAIQFLHLHPALAVLGALAAGALRLG